MSADIIESHCHSCGLYIRVPQEFAGGKGQCPRCKTIVRVPAGLRTGHPQNIPGMRYVAMPAVTGPQKKALAITSRHGPAVRFLCTECENTFESIKVFEASHKRCPNCGADGEPVKDAIKFPRPASSMHADIIKQQPEADHGVYIPEAIPVDHEDDDDVYEAEATDPKLDG
ncbi:MAG: hypothetical protein GVY16_11020 [Planctomycetes bacterium]|jgi:NAD-dependent SIR2 family protein deacetylase|nr:hypothetical protein [Phycisphaerae bacterium]NBB96254.1 hypothetical protein [Planctomycetota bacterium]